MDRVAPEKQIRPLPSTVVFTDDERTIMINQYHAKVIDRLRLAAKEHGVVADLLQTIADSFQFFPAGDSKFTGDEESRAYILAAINANSFVEIDREEEASNGKS